MEEVAAFKAAVIRIRDILRGPKVCITGMDSMRHICLYIVSRFLTRERVAALGVPPQFAWEVLIETARHAEGGQQKALDNFFHKEADCLVTHFDRAFGTEKFSFDIKDLGKHKEILEILDRVDVAAVAQRTEILGWVYEQHLKTGSAASRDLGQFFTDRAICAYTTALCAPGFKHPGVPESVCDPAMGTGGFLCTAIKYFKTRHAATPINWSVQQSEFHGNDTDPKVAGLARLNLFMETGYAPAAGGAPAEPPRTLRTHDSLYGDLMRGGYDVILANMPFGVKGIKHAECCERIKALKIRGTKSEPLFLQLMMVSLNRGGRCAVVVPDGMLVNSSECHDGTRKYLMEHFELKRIIKMRGQFFMNTGIQPSILFFENTGNPTTAVEFWDVVKGSNGFIEETMVLSVPRERFDASCSLDMRRYQETKDVANSAGFPMVNISEKCSMAIGGTPLRSKSEYYENGQHVWVSVSELNNKIIMDSKEHINDEGVKHSNVKLVKKGSILMSFKMSIGKCAIAGVDLYTNEAIVAFNSKDKSILSNQYLFYYLSLRDLSNAGKGSIGAGSMNKESLSELTMPLPPLAIQAEIVATLDRIYQPGTTELAETLKLTSQAMDLVLAQPSGVTLEPIVEAQRLMRKSAQMVADVKAQMVAIMKSVGIRGFETNRVGDLVDMSKGKLQATKCDGGEYPVISISNKWTHSTHSDEGEHVYIASTSSGASSGPFETVVKYYNGKCSSTTLMQRLDIKIVNKISYKYLYYGLNHMKEIIQNMCEKGSCNKTMNVERFLDLQIVVPPVDIQQDIIRRIGIIESQLTSLENLGKQAEDNARFILESYLGSTAPMPTAQSSDAHSSTCKVDEGGVGCTCRAAQPRDDACDDACDDAPMIARDDAPMIAAQAAGALGRAD